MQTTKTRIYIISLMALLPATSAVYGSSKGDSASSREYQVKAAFVYNFIKFVDWPKGKIAESNDIITIGIIGKDPFGKAFAPIIKKKIKEKKLLIKHFPQVSKFRGKYGSEQYEKQYLSRYGKSMKNCHVLFICSSEREYLPQIVDVVKDSAVLTVGETKGLLEAGGIIRFMSEEKKVRFEINAGAAKLAKLKIRSQLLRLAKRVVKKKKSGDGKK